MRLRWSQIVTVTITKDKTTNLNRDIIALPKAFSNSNQNLKSNKQDPPIQFNSIQSFKYKLPKHNNNIVQNKPPNEEEQPKPRPKP